VNVVPFLGACGVGIGAAACAGIAKPPTARLSSRVRGYAVVARAALGRPPEPARRASMRSTLLARVSAAMESRSDDAIALALRQAGMPDLSPDDVRVRQVVRAAVGAFAGGVAVALTVRTPMLVLGAAAAGGIWGATSERRRVDRAIAHRNARLRQELYTVNQLLAMHLRTGAGPIQAVQRVVARGHGVLVSDLAEILTWIGAGMSESDAYRRAAELTGERSATRTYRLLAAGIERGGDLSAGLLALSADLRDARREQLHKDAVRRRAAMLVPTIGILAPIMLLFIAAPLPSIVLGHR
jgi:Flp pilus assembly protein TadB